MIHDSTNHERKQTNSDDEDYAREAAITARWFDSIGRVAALYADDFGWDVRPAREGDKLPIVKWSIKNAPNPLAGSEMFAHWQENPRYNIAVLTGARSRLLVLDLDHHPDKYPLSLDERLALLARHDWPLATCQERTGGGGAHLYYALPAGALVRSVDAYLASGIELKAEGRLVIVAPSRTSKGQYHWVQGRDPWTLPMAPVPDAVLASLSAPRVAVASENEPIALSAGELRAMSRYAPRLVKRAVQRVKDGRDGGRHNTGLWLACQLRDLRVFR